MTQVALSLAAEARVAQELAACEEALAEVEAEIVD